MRTILLFVLFGFVCMSATNQDPEEKLIWKNTRKLSWRDYRGKPQKRGAAASTVYSLSHTLYNDAKGNTYAGIRAFFYPNDSWKSKWTDETLLAHEQKHFDLVELYARIMRKNMCTRLFQTKEDARKTLDSLYKITDQELDHKQDQYDQETDFSMAHAEQIVWIRKIELQLDSLHAYEDPEVKLKIAF